jgi:ABC-type transporter Mla subunit MlaD
MRSVVWSLLFVVSLTSSACFEDARTAYVLLPSGFGIKEKTPVTYLDVEIGRVSELAFVDQKVRLTLSLSRTDAPIRTQDSVRIAGDVFGSVKVEIVPGARSAALLADGGTLRQAAQSDSASLSPNLLELLASCGDKLPKALQDSVGR